MPQTANQEATIDNNFVTLYGAPEGQDARLLADKARALSKEQKVLVHIALDDTRLSTLHDLIAFFAPDIDVVTLPAWDCLPYDRVSPNAEIVAQRVHALTRLLEWQASDKFLPRIVLITVNAVLQRVTPQAALKEASFIAAKNQRLNLEYLQSFMMSNGYQRTETVREAGEYAMRGGIIDLFPPGYEKPVRLDLFGDEIEKIRTFDAMSQRSEGEIDSFSLRPVTEFFLDDDSIHRFRSGYREAFGTVNVNDPLYESISGARRYNGMEHWLPLFYDHMETVFDYISDCAITMDHHARRAHTERLEQIQDFYEARMTLNASQTQKKSKDVSLTGSVYNPLKPDALYLSEAEWQGFEGSAEGLSPFKPTEVEEGAFDAGARKGRDFADIRALPDGDVFAELKAHITALSRKTMIACYSQGSMERLKGMIENAGIDSVEYCVLPLEHGFVADDLAVLTEQDILGDRLARKASKKRKADNFLTEISSLDEGDLVVHVDHGVGRFLGLETIEAAKVLHDCLKIEYHGGDTLYVPVENIEVLSRFGSDEGLTQLDKLGGAGWQARKAKAKKDLMKMAEGLLKIAAARTLRKADKLEVSSEIYNEFASRFPYHETDDQERAIKETLEDLADGKPMDRLICGDVGFGKTEIALRAAYVAAMDGYQVAIIAPTTLLVRQHYLNFVKRFEGTGVRIEQLSRLVSAKNTTAIKDGLKDGSVNIVIGTHALLAESIQFSKLGLVVVDEEQRFGVKQKERLKKLKNDVHVLTLTATPIPRTLQMSLTGVKEMSIIATPPVDRLAIRTFVLPFDAMVIREAILREHYRGGQTFYVCPRIKDIQEVEEQLKELVPEVKTITAHGQMSPTDLEDRMTAFCDGQYNVLLSTNIIESGIDIPSANTMIVHRADLFGLAQLYQIRGRIGRSKVRAYAYLTYLPNTKLTQQAMKRLEVIETLDTLGSGFQLASHDMDIRGAGNLLGEEQSGHIKEVGVELYQQMLEEAVAAAKAGVDLDSEEMPDQWSPTINLGTSVLIPETYVEDLSVRMSLYRRLADLNDKDEIESFAAELIDRFGDIPEEVDNLLDIVKIKQMCKTAGIDRVEAGPKGVLLGFHNDTPPNVEALMGWIASRRGSIKLRPDQKLVASRQWDTVKERVRGVQSMMKELADLPT
ncbi:MAG: transcription-repair coupling factor [Pseudomonadota bacterium]